MDRRVIVEHIVAAHDGLDRWMRDQITLAGEGGVMPNNERLRLWQAANETIAGLYGELVAYGVKRDGDTFRTS